MLIQGDAGRIPLADESCHMCVTSPPYWGLRSYNLPPTIWDARDGCGHEWLAYETPARHGDDGATGSTLAGSTTRQENCQRQPTTSQFCRLCGAWRGTLGLEPTPELYVRHIVQCFREVRRVLRSDGTVWLNLGDSYAAQQGTGFNTNAMTGGSNRIQAMQTTHGDIRLCTGLPAKNLVGIPWRVAFALQADGWWLRSDIIWSKPNPMPESVTDRPTKSHEYLFLLSKNARYYYDAEAIKEASVYPNDNRKARSDEVQKRMPTEEIAGVRPGSATYPTRNRRTVWSIATESYSGSHFATFAQKLVEPCVLAGTSAKGACPICGAPWERVVERGERIQSGHHRGAAKACELIRQYRGETSLATSAMADGLVYSYRTVGWRPTCEHDEPPRPCIVLDCFAGTGTVGLVCARHGRDFIGIDLSGPYLRELATERLSVPQQMVMT